MAALSPVQADVYAGGAYPWLPDPSRPASERAIWPWASDAYDDHASHGYAPHSARNTEWPSWRTDRIH